MGAYDRIRVNEWGAYSPSGQHLLNRRTKALFAHAKQIYYVIGGTGKVLIFQGNYSDLDASAGTHTGGGAIDTGLTNPSAKNWRLWEKAQRLAMFMAYDRPPLYRNGEKVWDHHDHAAPLGDKEASGSLKRQYQDYYGGRNALADHSLEPASKFRPPVIFTPSYPLPTVDLSNMRREAKATAAKKIKRPGVKHIQRALNLKIGSDLVVDGIYGRATKRQMARWETMVGGDGDGIPGEFALTLLGAGRFNVKP